MPGTWSVEPADPDTDAPEGGERDCTGAGDHELSPGAAGVLVDPSAVGYDLAAIPADVVAEPLASAPGIPRANVPPEGDS